MKRRTEDIETLLIGAFLLDAQNYWSISEVIKPEHFTAEFRRRAFTVIERYLQQYRPVSLHLIAASLADLELDHEPRVLLSLAMEAAAKHDQPLLLQEYAEVLRETYLRTVAEEALQACLKDVRKGETSVAIRIEQAAETMAALAGQATEHDAEMLPNVIRRVGHRALTRDAEPYGLDCGLADVTEMTGLWMPGDLILLGGGSASGKTALAAQLLVDLSHHHNVDLYELEMENERLAARILASIAQVPSRPIMERRLKTRDMDKVEAAMKTLASSRLRMIDEGRLSVAQIRARSLARKQTEGLAAVSIDHAKLIAAPSKKFYGAKHEAVYENAAELKSLAKTLRVPIILLCQFTKGSRNEPGRLPEPNENDFFGGGIVEHADLMLAVFNRHDYLSRLPMPKNPNDKDKRVEELLESKGKIELIKLKDRNGPSHEKKILRWDAQHTRFSSLQDDPPVPPELDF